MKYYFFFLLVFVLNDTYSQQLQYEVNSASATSSHNDLTVNWSIGGLAYHHFCNSDYCLSGDWVNDDIVFGIGLVSENNTINLFPNPISDILNIDVNSLGDFPINLVLYDIGGGLVYQQQLRQMDKRINFSQLNSGYYLCEFILSNGNKEIFRMIKK